MPLHLRSASAPLLALAIAGMVGAAPGPAKHPVRPSTREDRPRLASRLSDAFLRAHRRWDPDPWSYGDPDDPGWAQGDSIPDAGRARFSSSLGREPMPNRGSEARPCSLTVWCRFVQAGDTIALTMGRAPESCSEAPRMLWVDPDGRPRKDPLPPLFNWNVDALWWTGDHLVFGLQALYEGGEHDERLAFWRMSDGLVVIGPSLSGPLAGPPGPGPVTPAGVMPGWRDASVAVVRDAIVVAHADTILVYWPERRVYAMRFARHRAGGHR